MRAELKALHHRLKTTVIYVTHDQAEAMTLGDRVVVMSDGRVQQVAPPLVVYDFPANRFVAGFLGTPSMNFIPGQLVQSNGAVTFVTVQSRLKLLPQMAQRVLPHVGKKVTLGIRPEDLGASGEGKFAGVENTLPATVRVVEPLGDEQVVHLRGPGDVSLVCKLDPHVRVGVDEALSAHLAMNRVHVFDDQTGCNISLEPEHVARAS
jgi:multiple sugar transport system ATP-binding protein